MKFSRGQTAFFINNQDGSNFYNRFLGEKVTIQDYDGSVGKYLIRFSDTGVTWVYEHQLSHYAVANDVGGSSSGITLTPEEEALILRRRQANAGFQQYNEGLEAAARMVETTAMGVAASLPGRRTLIALAQEIRAVKVRLR